MVVQVLAALGSLAAQDLPPVSPSDALHATNIHKTALVCPYTPQQAAQLRGILQKTIQETNVFMAKRAAELAQRQKEGTPSIYLKDIHDSQKGSKTYLDNRTTDLAALDAACPPSR